MCHLRLSNNTSKTKNTFKESPSFVCEIPLKVSRIKEKILLARLEAARQVYNACLGEAIRRLNLVQQSKPYRIALSLPKGDPTRSTLFTEARAKYEFKDSALQRYAVVLRRSWIGEHLDVHTTQRLATRAFRAAGKMLYGKARKVRFKGKNQMDTVESKSNAAGIRWRENHVEWLGLHLFAIIDYQDPVVRHGLSCRVKYVRLVKRKINGKNRFYAQLVCEGFPYIKEKNRLGEGVVGLDIGPSTVAGVGENDAYLKLFCSELARKERAIRVFQRKLDRQRRANNPENYSPDGTVKKGPRVWRKSKHYRRTQAELAEIHRKLAAHRRSLHGRLVNGTLRMGDVFKVEKLSYRAFQVIFGRSVNTRAPGRFIAILSRKAESAGGKVIKFPTRLTKLSQTCHCGMVHKKCLSERWHICPCGATAQRDLYSAFLARHVDPETNLLHVGQAFDAWPGAEPLLRAAWQQAVENQPASGRIIPSSFGLTLKSKSSGLTRSQSRSSVEGETAKAESRDVVAYPQGDGESLEEAKVVFPRTPRL